MYQLRGSIAVMQRSYRDRVYERYRSARGGAVEHAKGTDAFFRHVVRAHFPKARSARVLDLGCGAGYLVRATRAEGYTQVEGVDAAPEQVQEAARLGITGIRQGDIRAHLHTIGDCELEVVLAFDLLEHMTKDELFSLVDEIYRVLVPNGRLIVHTVNAESPFFGRVRHGDITHEQAFTAGSLDQLLHTVGFSAVKCFEDRPVVHGLASAARRVVWSAARTMLVSYLVAESGPNARHAILSQNLTCVAIK
jgi:SAM-dependent methyltransferase